MADKNSIIPRLAAVLLTVIPSLSPTPGYCASRFMMPQTKPDRGPWYEGWYVRVTDHENNFSFATISTSDTPEKIKLTDDSVLPGYVAFLHQEGGSGTTSLEYFPEKTFLETNDKENKKFAWRAEGLGSVADSGVDFQFPNGEEVKVDFGPRKPWSEKLKDWGPGGPATFLPFAPMFWYVDSIGTPVTYRVKLADGKVREGRGFAHVEKNWGKIFPRAWMWLQAVSPENDAAVALAGGPLGIAPLELTAYFVGYKSTHVDMEIRPDQLSLYSTTIQPEKGFFRLEAKNLRDRLVIEAQADPKGFAPVSIPTKEGYRPNGGIESFSATIIVKAYRLGRLLETKTFNGGALEFGADNMKAKK